MKLKIAPSHLSTGLMFAVVRLVAVDADGDEAIGTGFFFRIHGVKNSDVLVTNKHVIEGAEEIRFPMHQTSIDSDGRVELGHYEVFTTEFADWLHHPDPDVDLCCLRIAPLAAAFEEKGYYYQVVSSASIMDAEELERLPTSIGIAMVGFPTGLWDSHHGLPIIRHGVTASHAAVPFEGKSDVVVDIACFPGSSGSPIMFDDRNYFASAARFLGVLHSGPTMTNTGEIVVTSIPTRKQLAVVDTMMHLGYAVSASKVLELAEIAVKTGTDLFLM
jgi:hypothetical protein